MTEAMYVGSGADAPAHRGSGERRGGVGPPPRSVPGGLWQPRYVRRAVLRPRYASSRGASEGRPTAVCRAMMAFPPDFVQGLRRLGFIADALELHSLCIAACLRARPHHKSSIGVMTSWIATRHLWTIPYPSGSRRPSLPRGTSCARELAEPLIAAAKLRLRAQAELAQVLRARLYLAAVVSAGSAGVPHTGRRAWARNGRLIQSSCSSGAVTFLTRSSHAFSVPSGTGGVAPASSSTARPIACWGAAQSAVTRWKPFLFRSVVLDIARRHRRFVTEVVRDAGVAALAGRIGLPGDRGSRLALHIDAALMAYNRVHNSCGGDGLKEDSRRFPEVAKAWRQRVVDRSAATLAARPPT